MHRIALALLFAVLASGPARAADEAGRFDHYVLALSWNASWCEEEGDRRGAPQCDSRHDIGFVVHGLWPQDTRGWPEYCRTRKRDPRRAETAAMADIMGSGGLAWHQWKKHGRCTGLGPAEYFALTRKAHGLVKRPEILRQVQKPLRLAPAAVEAAFLEANPGFHADGVTVTCRDGLFREVRVCLSRTLQPRRCSGRTVRDCGAGAMDFPPMR